MEFKTVKEQKNGIIVEKKSKFIANIIPVTTKQEAENKIKEIKKQYSDAKHNCYAYCILENESKITKSSDDGEPSGTAGIPILKVITENDLCNVLIIVTRYFGGVLLGTGGLVRAYTSASLEAINNSQVLQMQLGYEIKIEITYDDLNFVKYTIEAQKGKIIDVKYGENIEIIAQIKEENKNDFMDENGNLRKKNKENYRFTKKIYK